MLGLVCTCVNKEVLGLVLHHRLLFSAQLSGYVSVRMQVGPDLCIMESLYSERLLINLVKLEFSIASLLDVLLHMNEIHRNKC